MSYDPHQATPLSQKGYFDDNSSRYRLCCCHVRTWAMVIGVVELIGIIIQLISGIVSYAKAGRVNLHAPGMSTFSNFAGQTLGGMIGGIVFFVIGVIAVILLIYALRKEKHLFVIPHLIMQILAIIGAIVMAIFFFIAVGQRRRMAANQKENNALMGVTIGGGIGLLFTALAECFFLYAIYRCYQYLKEKNLANEAASYVPMASSYAAVEKGH